MIHDRFRGQWNQPTSVIENRSQFVTTVRIRIERDGRVSSARIIRASGNPVMDQSVQEAITRVQRIQALPDGLGQGAYEININFELD